MVYMRYKFIEVMSLLRFKWATSITITATRLVFGGMLYIMKNSVYLQYISC